MVVTEPVGTSASLGGPPLVAMVSCGTKRRGRGSGSGSRVLTGRGVGSSVVAWRATLTSRSSGSVSRSKRRAALDRVSAVAKRLSRARVQRNNEMGEWQSKGKHQARPLLLAKQALKLRRPLLRFLD